MTSKNPLPEGRSGMVDHSSGRSARAFAKIRELGPIGLLQLARQSGLRGTCEFALRNVRHQIAHFHALAFDRREGVDTAGSIQLDELNVVGPNKAVGNEAVSTSPKSFNWLLRQAPLPNNATFIDIGCGKGRTVLLASTRFHRSFGVEFAAELVVVARRNLDRYAERHPEAGMAEIVHQDATQFLFPDGPLVVYFYNPFSEALLRQVMGNLARDLAHNPRPCTLIYASGMGTIRWADRAIKEAGGFKQLKAGSVPGFWDAIRQMEYGIYGFQGRNQVAD
jgi:SAM-dependent methyltransferase